MTTSTSYSYPRIAPAPEVFVKDGMGNYIAADDKQLLDAAKKRLEKKFQPGLRLTSSKLVRDYLTLNLALLEHEVFGVVWVDNQHSLITYETMFRGTIDSASVYPREVVKAALQHNAAACFLTHNHPSGSPVPSDADRRITERIKQSLDLIEVRILDHFIVAGEEITSFVEKGIL